MVPPIPRCSSISRKSEPKQPSEGSPKPKPKEAEVEAETEVEEEEEKEEEKAPVRKKRATTTRKKAEPAKKRGRKAATEESEEEEAPAAPKKTRRTRKSKSEEKSEPAESDSSEDAESDSEAESGDKESKPKHTLTCQTCGKSFEHMNPRLRDCLDCYRIKRKERRRGGDRHKNVIQHPLAQQVASKMANQQDSGAAQAPQVSSRRADPPAQKKPQSQTASPTQPVIGGLKTKVRSYRKAIDETRQITGSLKRRLERPDLPEGERRWLEQIYAYQLILHQGWRHLSEYKSTTQQQAKLEDSKGRKK